MRPTVVGQHLADHIYIKIGNDLNNYACNERI